MDLPIFSFGEARAPFNTSMDPITITAASGMRARMESLDMLANNIANAETGGYKTDREFYSVYTSEEARASGTDDSAGLPVIEKNYTDYSQGSMRVTSNPLDLGIQGKGFFAVDSPAGVAYTRNGSFQVTAAGKLVNGDGYAVRDSAGKPITLDATLAVDVSSDGTISQSGQAVAKLAVLDFANQGDLVKQGNTMFRATDPKAVPKPSSATVQQGRLESSNVTSSESTVRLVSVMRQFDMLQKATHIGQTMNSKAIDEVAKVG
jgi:flagellar basal-body rod protein FlgF